MVSAHLDDGQSLTALNEVFVGHASDQSARYRLSLSDVEERESSSGLIVATGTDATGWAASLHLERRSSLVMPSPEERRLAFFVREPRPSVATGTELTEGSLSGGNASSSAVSCPRAVSSSATGSRSTGCRSVG
jgi:hypothetical protein